MLGNAGFHAGGGIRVDGSVLRSFVYRLGYAGELCGRPTRAAMSFSTSFTTSCIVFFRRTLKTRRRAATRPAFFAEDVLAI